MNSSWVKSAWWSLFLVWFLCAASAQAAVLFKAAASASARTATISYRAVGSVANASSGNLTVSLPAAAFGEMFLCQVASRDNVAHTMPAAWTQVYSLNTSTTHRASLFYKVSAASETNPIITHTGGSNIIARCTRFRGVDPGDPFDVAYAAQYAASSVTVTSGSLTTVTANDILLFAAHLASNPSTLTTPSGWTRPYYSTTTGAGIAMNYKLQASAAAVGPFTATASAAAENHGVLLALQPAATLTINKPTGTIAGDVMVAAIATVPNTIPITPPTGWTLIQSQQQTTGNKSVLATYYRVAGASEGSNYTWTLSKSHAGAVGGIVTYSGVDTAAPLDVSAKAATPSSVNHAAPSLTTTQASDLLVTVHEYASARSWTPPTGMTERVDIASRSPNNSGVTLEMNDLSLGAAGVTGTKTATASSSADTGATVSLALKALAMAPHHVEIWHDGAGITCAPETVTVRACADASCATLYTGGVTGTLTPSGSSFTIGASGSTTGTVNPTTAGTYTLGISSLLPAPSGTPNVSCLNTATGAASCSIVFTAGGLSVAIPNFPAATGTTTATLTVTDASCKPPFTGNRSVKLYTSYTNPSTGTQQASVNGTAISTSSASPTTLTLNFNSSGVSTISVNYSDVGRLTLDATDAVTGTRGNGAFVAYPASFALSAIKRTSDNFANPGATNAAGTKFVKAGENFSVTVTAQNSLAVATPNFGRESPAESVTLTSALIVDGDLTNNPALGGIFGAFSSGIASGTTFTWNEVGIITLMPNLASGNYLSTGNNVTSTSSTNVGRFYLHHFDMTPDTASPISNRSDLSCGACTFTYMGELMEARFSLTAKAQNGDATLNYTGSYAKLDPAAVGNPLGIGAVDSTLPTYLNTRIDTSVNATGSFSGGEAVDIVAPFSITRGVTPDGPYSALKIGVAPLDADGAAMGTFDLNTDAIAANDHALLGATDVRYGRLKLSNAHGSEFLSLPAPIAVQYWNGLAYRNNPDDNDTLLLTGNIVLSNYQKNLSSGETIVTAPVIAAGVGQILFSAPGAANDGSVDFSANAPTYLPSNTARATFGIYKGGPLIYQRENF